MPARLASNQYLLKMYSHGSEHTGQQVVGLGEAEPPNLSQFGAITHVDLGAVLGRRIHVDQEPPGPGMDAAPDGAAGTD